LKEFLELYPDQTKFVTPRRFKQYLQAYGRFMGYKYNDGNTGGRWSIFTDETKPSPELDDEGKEIVPF